MSDFLTDPPPLERCVSCWNVVVCCTCWRRVEFDGKVYAINDAEIDRMAKRVFTEGMSDWFAESWREAHRLARADMERMAGHVPLNSLFEQYVERNIDRLEQHANGGD